VINYISLKSSLSLYFSSLLQNKYHHYYRSFVKCLIKFVSANELLFSPAFGLIRLPCPSVLSRDSKRTDKVSHSKLCRNVTYVNGVC
jgi:hypothetical protein